MRKTYRMLRGFIANSMIFICLLLWAFFRYIYPTFTSSLNSIHFPYINSSIFLFISLISFTGLVSGWSIRNRIWKGLSYSIQHYFITKNIRKYIKDARFESEDEFDNRLVRLPKLKVIFDNSETRESGKIFIQNSIKFDKKLEDMRIDSALRGYISERQYLSTDRKWYIYEFYAVDSHKQIEIKSLNDLIGWSNEKTDDYELRLDERTIVPFHHFGLVGQTGSGKSFFIQMLVEQVLSKKVNHELFIVDPKRTDVYLMAKQKIGSENTADKTNAIDLIKAFHMRMKNRQDEMQEYLESNRNKTYKDAEFPALILLIDEFGALRESWKVLPKKERDEVDSILSDIAFMGRQLGCILWVATQQMNAQTIPTAIREQLVLKVALGDSDEQTYKTLFASGVDIPPMNFTAGQGVYSYPGIASTDKPRLISVPYCSFLD